MIIIACDMRKHNAHIQWVLKLELIAESHAIMTYNLKTPTVEFIAQAFTVVIGAFFSYAIRIVNVDQIYALTATAGASA